MGRKSAPVQDFMPVPTEAVQIPEVPVPTEDLFANRPRTKKDWMEKARASKSSKGAPGKGKAPARVPQPMDDMPATQQLEEVPPTQLLAEDTLVPTQKLAEEHLPPTQQLAEEETSEPSSLIELSPTQPAAAPVTEVYGRCKRRRTKSSAHSLEGSSKAAESRSIGKSLPRRTSMSGMTFHDFVEMGRQVQQRVESGTTAALQPPTLKEGTHLEDQPAPMKKLAEDILPPTQKLVEDEPMATEQLDPTDHAEDVPIVATEKLDGEESKDEQEPDLHGLLQRQIFELEEVATEMTQRQKALLGVYKALKAFL